MPTINKGSDYFGVLTYTGDGAASKTVVDTSAVSFQPDFVWVKGRSGATDHALYDSVRGTTKQLESNTTTAETTETTGLTSFVNGGFTVGNLAQMNTSGATYVAWCWKAGGSTSSNTQGAITSTVSVNTTAGFSVVTYTGNGSNATVGHGLGVAPKMVIIKARGAVTNWTSYHEPIGNTAGLHLNTTGGSDVNSGFFNNTSPTSTTFAIGSGSTVNTNGGTYVAYCWAEIAGFSKFGSYTGNGSADGVFVYTGFRPAFVLFKNASAAYSWMIKDNKRANPYNVTDGNLYPDLNAAEDTGSTAYIDLLSNGFKMRGTSSLSNGSGNTIIYAAFAENPFKNALAR